jgi:hypothetical protein
MMSLLRTLAIAAALVGGAPTFAQEPDTVRITATAPLGRPTLMSYLGGKPIPVTVDALIARLNEPNTCGKEAWPLPDPNKPCAIIAYYLVDRDETLRTPQLVFRSIQYVTHPANPADTTLRMIDLDGRLRSYSDEKLDEPLRPMRVENSCVRVWDTRFIVAKEVKKCKRVNARYIPFGILGYIENDEQKILTGKAKDAFFSLTLQEE